jgi:hydroxymethylbilane synthase
MRRHLGPGSGLAGAGRAGAASRPRDRGRIVTVKTTGDRLSAAGQPIGGRATSRASWTRRCSRVASTSPCTASRTSRRPSRRASSSPPSPGARIPATSCCRGTGSISPTCRAAPAWGRRAPAGAPSCWRRGRTSRSWRRAGTSTRASPASTQGRWDAIVLARAGLARLGRLEEIVEAFPDEVLLPAVGRGRSPSSPGGRPGDAAGAREARPCRLARRGSGGARAPRRARGRGAARRSRAPASPRGI